MFILCPITKALEDNSIPFSFSLDEIKSNLIIAVNQEYVGTEDTVQLKAGDEVAVIPPISGG